jgi:hypothetical protein
MHQHMHAPQHTPASAFAAAKAHVPLTLVAREAYRRHTSLCPLATSLP